MKSETTLLHYKPIEYCTQPFFRFCWAFQLHAIATSKQISIDPFSIFSWWNRFSWFCQPKTLYTTAKKLFTQVSYHRGDGDINTLRSCIDHGQVAVILIWHAYNKDWVWFNPLKALLYQHYISIWWYDDNGFYIYDSSISQERET